MPIPDWPQRDIYSVSPLVRDTGAVLEGSFPLPLVSGEIPNLAQPASGHSYFSLTDEIAQARCAMFRTFPRAFPGQPDCARGEEKSERRHDHAKYHVSKPL